MTGPSYEDTISRCDPPSFYDAVRHPSHLQSPKEVTPPAKPRTSSIDTLESSVHQKQEVGERTRSHGLTLPHESFVAVAQVGKYLFLAIMLPPYLCLYGIPKWMIANLLPQVFSFSKNVVTQCCRSLYSFAKRVADLMKGILDQTLGQALRVVGDQARNLWKQITGYLAAASHALSQQLTKALSSLELVKSLFNPIKDNINAFQRYAAEKFQSLGLKIQSWMQTISQLMVSKGSEMTLPSWATTAWSDASSKVDGIKIRLAQLAHYLGHQSKKVLDVVKSSVQTVAGWVAIPLVQLRDQLLSPLSVRIASAARKGSDKVRRIKNRVVEVVWPPCREVINKMASSTQVALEWVQVQLAMAPAVFIETLKWMGQWLPFPIRRSLRQLAKKGKRKAEAVKRVVVTAVGFIKKQMQRGGKQLKKTLQWIYSRAKKQSKKLFLHFLKALKALPQVMNLLWYHLKRGMSKGVYALLVAIVWIVAVFRIWMASLRQVTSGLHKN